MRVLLVAATTGYQTRSFAEAAARLGLECVLATDRCKGLDDPWADAAIPVRFHQPEQSAASAVAAAGPIDGIVAVGDRTLPVAAHIAAALGLPFHAPAAVEAARNKYLARERFRAAGLSVPAYFRVPLATPPLEALGRARLPCVLKPLGLSGSRGVIRANTPEEFVAAFERIRRILELPEILRLKDDADHFVQIEDYIPGREYAVEGLLTRGRLETLAIFDKPDPLDGPYFEETLYVTPSRGQQAVQRLLCDTVARAAAALGLSDGPLHAELRHNDGGAWILEVAGRPIGGLCSRALRFRGGLSLEEVILRHALGSTPGELALEAPASGVMMIPIPRNGIFQAASGQAAARAVPDIEDCVITAKTGQLLERLPEGSSYLGFLFASAQTPAAVEAALRAAHAELSFEIAAVVAFTSGAAAQSRAETPNPRQRSNAPSA